MTPDRWKLIDELYHATLDLDVSARDEFLKKQCAGDESLRREVEVLLSAHEKAGDFIDTTALNDLARKVAADSGGGFERRQINQYRMLSRLGAGGMGDRQRLEEDLRPRGVIDAIVRTGAKLGFRHSRFLAPHVGDACSPHLLRFDGSFEVNICERILRERLLAQAQQFLRAVFSFEQRLHPFEPAPLRSSTVCCSVISPTHVSEAFDVNRHSFSTSHAPRIESTRNVV
jgi:hypothetical protein